MGRGADFYWRQGYFKSLTDLANEASTVPEWKAYAEYCRALERGLRKHALSNLERFLDEMEVAPFADRRRFVGWVLLRSNRRDGKDVLIPHPLREKLVKPTLYEWLEKEPSNSEPYRWIGDERHLRTALELDPQDQVARKEFIVQMLSRIDFNTHHLPHGYLGTAKEDFGLLDEIEAHIAKLPDASDRQVFFEATTSYRDQIRAYVQAKDLS